MKYTLVKDTGNYPYRNIALEKYLFDTCQEDEMILYLWVNDPCVIAGCNQNVLVEWDSQFLQANQIYPIRRFTGGGCVYHDRGNLNYSFISHLNHKNVDKWIDIILQAVNHFGGKASFSGRNDLILENRKFGGTAWLEEEDKILFHGTLMIDVDIETMVKALTPNMLKFEGKAIASVRSRVINLASYFPELNIDTLITAIEHSFISEYGKLIPKQIAPSPEWNKIVEQLTAKQWIYHRNADCDISLSYKINNQIIELDLKIEANCIKNIEVFTDSMDILVADRIKNELLGLVYTDTNIQDKLFQILA